MKQSKVIQISVFGILFLISIIYLELYVSWKK